MQERREARSHSAVANMIAPLQVTVGTATGKIINIFFVRLVIPLCCDVYLFTAFY